MGGTKRSIPDSHRERDISSLGKHPRGDEPARPYADFKGDYADFADLSATRDASIAQRAGILW